MEKHLHIITHELPWPPGYGGVMDIYHKVRALHAEGVRIHLHCFTKGKIRKGDLDDCCASVHYYPRTEWPLPWHWHLPYIVSTRISKQLLKRLLEDDHPILAEGIHVSHVLLHKKLSRRKKFLRLHNVESLYYSSLARIEKSLPKKTYYFLESILLRRYEKKIAAAVPVIAVSENDRFHYQHRMGAFDARFLPVFHGFSARFPEGKGFYCLYHGNLSVNENEKAVRWLLKHVFSKLHIPFIVAGRGPSSDLRDLINEFPYGNIVADPSEEDMRTLVRDAQVHLIPSFNNTGVKLKLIHALFEGRHCLVNRAAVAGSGLEACCRIAESPKEFRDRIKELMETAFTEDDFVSRKAFLGKNYDNGINAELLMKWIC